MGCKIHKELGYRNVGVAHLSMVSLKLDIARTPGVAAAFGQELAALARRGASEWLEPARLRPDAWLQHFMKKAIGDDRLASAV